MLPWLSLVAGITIALLGWNLVRRFSGDRIDALGEKRRATSRIVSRGEFVDGNQHVDVSLALNQSTFFYENADIQGSLELHWVSEVEYDTRLASGATCREGHVLRLRCYSRTFEFVLPVEVVSRWHMMLPPRRGKDAVPPIMGPQVAPA